RIDHELLTHRSDEHVRIAYQSVQQRGRTVDLHSVHQPPGSVDGDPSVGRAPSTERVVVLECKSNWVHQPVTARTGRIPAMYLHSIAHGFDEWAPRRLVESRDVWGRRWRRRAENVFQDPFAADDGRGASRQRRDEQDRPFAEQPTTLVLRDV